MKVRDPLKSKSILLICLLLVNIVYSQDDWRLRINDEWFRNYGSKGLRVGDTMPDIPLGTVINNYTGKTRISDFKGKLVILDFWNIYCTTCIESFPYMEKLQKEFGDSIQIFLVNGSETQQQIEAKQKKAKFKLPDLPSIVADRPFNGMDDLIKHSPWYSLFPVRGNPHHVWIDEKGIIRLIGGHENTYAEKIRDILAGKNILVKNGNNTAPVLGYDKKTPYSKLLGNFKTTPVTYGSFITAYNNELGDYGNINEIIDSAAGTHTSQFINTDLLEIYIRGPLLKTIFFTQFNNSLLYAPNPVAWLNLLVFPAGIDTLNYTTLFIPERHLNDKDYMQSQYCYEQVVPLDMPEEKRRYYMLEDLNRFIEQQYGAMAVVEKRMIPYYALVRTSNLDKVNTTAKEQSFMATNSVSKGGKKITKYSYSDLYTVIDYTLRGNRGLHELMKQYKAQSHPFLILDETGWDKDKKMDLLLPSEGLNTIEDLRKVLQSYDLDIVEKQRTFDFLVFKKQ